LYLGANGVVNVAKVSSTGLAVTGTLSASGVSTFAAGTALLPALTTTGDTNTGIFFPAADTVATSVGGSEGMRLTSTGLGIGTTSPASILNVSQASPTITLTGSSDAVTAAGAINFSATSTVKWQIGTNLAVGNGLEFNTGSSTGNVMYIARTGNVGIGTGSPDANLTVNGAASFAAGTALLPSIARAGDLNTGLWFPAADTIAASTGGTERYRVDSSGNFGLGVAPSASTLATIQSTYGVLSGNTNINIVRNAYYSGGWKYVATDTATYYQHAGGQHIWYNAASGTAGTAITWTQAMTLNASGDLIIGGTGANAKLTVGTTDATAVIAPGGTNTSLTLGAMGADGVLIFKAGGVSNGNIGTERARIDAAGALLVGQTTRSQTAVGFYAKASDGEVSGCQAGSTNSATQWNTYSTGAGAYRFYVGMGGTIFATSIVITAISDERLKENVRDIDTGLNSIMALKPRRFDWKEGKGQDKKNAAGFIAQEFEQVFPECVSLSKAGADGIEYKNINHETLIPTLVKAMQEQQAIIESLKARLDAANL
jgi:hypothetical protein